MNHHLGRPTRKARALIASIAAIVLVGGAATAIVVHRTGGEDPVVSSSANAPTHAKPGAIPRLVSHRLARAVTLAWHAPDPGTLPAGAHLRYRVTTTPAVGHPRTLTTTRTTARVAGLQPGHSYTFAVSAFNTSGSGAPATTRVVLPLLRMRPGAAPDLDGVSDGVATVDSTVSVAAPRSAAWHHAAASFSYQWLSDGRPIRGAVHRTFTPTSAQAGHRLAVRITGHHSGYAAASVTSPAIVVSTSPLAGGNWGVYRGPWDGVYPAYEAAHGADKAELAKVALQPRMVWFASNQSSSRIGPNISSYISQVQDGDPNTLVQLALFRVFPDTDGSEGGRDHPLSGTEQVAYKTWMNNAANAIGGARAAVVLEPDLALVAPPTRRGAEATADPGVREALVRWAAKRLSELSRTTVYLDCGDADWLSVAACARLLVASGIQYARGFALGATHYSDVAGNVSYGAQLVDALAKDGYRGKHFVVDTADNGRGFTWTYWNAHQAKLGGDFDNAAACASGTETECDTLGLPPTAKTWDQPGLGLSTTENTEARYLVDGYLWFGRPWLDDQAAPFDLARTLRVARSTPYQ